jgi:serine/threonine-protein kinase
VPAPLPVGAGMLPGAPVEDDLGYAPRRDRREPERGGRGWSYALLALGILLVAGLVAFTIAKLGGAGSQAPTTATLPSVTGLTQDKAEAALKAKGFNNITTQNQVTTDSAPGLVLAQNPPPDTNVALTQAITLTVSKAPDTVNLPDLKGMSQNDATKKIQELGLKIGNVTNKDDKDLQQGMVISSDPGPGAVAKGTTVNLVLATGTVKLPNLVGLQFTDAVQKLADLGLRAAANPQTQTDPQGRPTGTVISQSPTPGEVPIRSAVTLVLSAGASPSASPSASPTTGPTTTTTPTIPPSP